jgi:hypothetical protein
VTVIVAVVLGLCSTTVATAAAGTVSTSLLPIADGQWGTCYISNVSDREVRNVVVEFRGHDGGTQTPPNTPFVLAPQASGSPSRQADNEHIRCVFRFVGATSAVRAHLCISNTPDGVCVSHAEAR